MRFFTVLPSVRALPSLLLGASLLCVGTSPAQEASPVAPAQPGAIPKQMPAEWLGMIAMLGGEGASMIPRAVIAHEVQKRFAEMDKDGDGKLSLAELGPNRWMRCMDTDFDGAVSKEELATFLANLEKAAKLPRSNPEAKYPDFSSDGNLLKQAPRLISPWPMGVGAIMAPDVRLAETGSQKAVNVHELCGEKGTVIALVSPSCPVSKRYLPALRRMEEEYAPRGFRFVFLASSAADSDADLAACAFQHPVLRDPSGALLRALGARATAEVFLLDARRTLIYRGAVDDQYGIGYSLDAPKWRFLSVALDRVLAGQRPIVAATESPACALELPALDAAAVAAPVTYHHQIARILQANCIECHSTGGLAPFALETLDQVNAKAKTIARVLNASAMPPWFAICGTPGAPSPWINDRSLRPEDKADLLGWLASADRPEGDPAEAPLPRATPPEWALGKPDLVLQIPNPIEIPAEGTMPWENIIVDPGLTEDKWAVAMEVQPSARAVVHHILIFVRPPQGQGLPNLGKFSGDEMEGFFAAYAPGTIPGIYPEGFAKLLPAGCKLRFQIHYTPNGTATHDQTRLGIRFASGPPRHEIETMPIANPMFAIPAGAPNYPVSAYVPITADIRVLSLTPHMHLRGKAFRFDVALPDGRERTLVDVPRYDFNWQVPCAYGAPPLLPAGSKLRATAWYDNSKDNPVNPNPNVTVRWGQRTSDEMMLGYLEYYRDRPDADPAEAARTASAAAPSVP